MASRNGLMPLGTDGTDFMHRETVANQYKISAKGKSRLKTCLFIQVLLFFIMLTKLSADILDKLDIFVMEIEELEIPKPLYWEYIWCFSLISIFFGLAATRKNNVKMITRFVYGTVIFGVLPCLFCVAYYLGDVYSYIITRSVEGVQVWQGYPYGILWYCFVVVALQVHFLSLYFAKQLLEAWKIRSSKKAY
ncbi:protein jagunal-like [Artemia franciscana]|uniref:protein jagunal-like n=1 Tax=Artemia franciscana TaxID=6661 RepID=UPI0032DA0297